MRFPPFSPEPISLARLGIEDYPLTAKVDEVLARPTPRGWRRTGMSAETYLDVIEHIVRYSAGNWMNPDGSMRNLLTDLEGQGQVELHGYEGRTPKFAGVFL